MNTTEWADQVQQWLDTDKKQDAALALLIRLWNDKTEPYRGDLEIVAFMYIHAQPGGSPNA